MSDGLDLSDGWTTQPLTEVADVIMGQSPPGSTYNTAGDGLPFFQGKTEFGEDHPTAVKWCSAPTRVAEPGDILMSVRAPVGPTNVADQRCAIGRGLAIIRPKSGVPVSLVRHAIKLQEDEIASWGTGTTFTAINKGHFKDITVSLPPNSMREAFASVLDETVIRRRSSASHLSRARKAIERFRQAVLTAACSGRLTADWRDSRDLQPADAALERRRESERLRLGRKYREPFAPEIDKLPDIPPGWAWATLPELGDLGRGKSKHRPRNDPKLYGGAYPFIQTGDVARSRGRITSHSQTYNEAGLAQSRLWPERTVCITIAANIADSGLLTYPACFPDSVVGLIADQSVVLPEYVELFIRTARRDLAMFAPATAQANINLAILSELAVAVPPLEEQRELISRTHGLFDSADSILARVEAASRRVDRTSQAVLAKAFRGELVAIGGME